MKKLFLLCLLFTTIKSYSQCNISPPIVSAHTLGTLPPNTIPVNTPTTYTFSVNFSSDPGSRIVEVDFSSGFAVQNPSIPFTRSGNTYRFDFSNTTLSNSATFSLWGSVDCSLCAGSSITVNMRVIQNNTISCTSTITSNVWNESLPWMIQSIRSHTTNNVSRGSVVRYHVTVSNNNPCFRTANANRMIQIIDQLPVGAQFLQAFILTSTSNIPINLTTQNLGNNQIGIQLIPSASNECYIDILYPCDFGSNTATNRLSYLDQTNVPCPFSRVVNANDVTVNIVQSPPSPPASFASVTKTLGAPQFTPNFNPGGAVAFEINFTNTGNVPLSTIEITDLLPASFIGTHVFVRGTVTASTQVGTPFTVSALLNNQWQTVTNTAYPNAPQSRGFRLNINPGHTLMPNESIRFWVYGTSDPNLFNETILNRANATYLPVIPNCGQSGGGGQQGPLNASGEVSFTTAGRNPNIKIAKLVCEKPCYNVGDEIQFQLHVINEGNAPLDGNGIAITDVLPANLTLIGGSERYYLFPYNMTTAHPSFIDCDNNTQYSNRELVNPSFIVSNNTNGATQLTWQINSGQLIPNPNLPVPIPANYTLYSDRIVITFRCRVNNIAMPGNMGHNNQVTTNRRDIVPDVNINVRHAIYYMCSRDELTAEKLVSTGGSVFTNQVNVPPGATVRYQIRLTNTGNMPLSQIRIVDDMPHVGDNRLGFFNGQQCTPRNSQFTINASHTGALSTGSIAYFTQHNPCVSSLFNYPGGSAVACCGTNSPTTTVTSPSAQGFYIDLGGMVMQPGDVWTYEFDGIVPQGLTNRLTSCNSFSYRAIRANSNVVLEFGESNNACVSIENKISSGCDLCKTVEVKPIHGRLIRQQTRGGVNYQTQQNYIRISAPNTLFNQIRVHVVSYQFEANSDECMIADRYAFNNVGINGNAFQQVNPFVVVNGQPTAPYNNTQHLNTNIGEVNWQTTNAFDLSNPVDLPIQLFLPDFSQLECCKVHANVCLRITFMNDECEVCERLVCFNTNTVDEVEEKCYCKKQTGFNIAYDLKKKTNQKKYPISVGCNDATKLPIGVPITFTNPNACTGGEKCKPRYEWQLVQASNQLMVSLGNANAINFTLPMPGEEYILYVRTYCGSNKCEEVCKISIKGIRP